VLEQVRRGAGALEPVLERLDEQLGLALAGILLGVASTSVAAQDVNTAERLNAFRQLDANGDGRLSKAEAARRREVATNFQRADANRDGRLSFAEFETIALNRSDQPGQFRNPERG